MCDDSRPPAAFTGTIGSAVLESLGVLPRDVRHEIEARLRRA